MRGRAALSLVSIVVALGGSSACDGESPRVLPDPPTPTSPTPPRSSATARPTVSAPPEVSCASLGARFRAASRAVDKRCRVDGDCALHGSLYNCYALHGSGADLAPLEAVEAVMARQGCAKVECEPPPRHACKAGLCGWDH